MASIKVETAALLIPLFVACGGRSEREAPAEPVQDDGCRCPESAPGLRSSCDCPGLSCEFGRQYLSCWNGQARCENGAWLYYGANTICPETLDTAIGALCNGEGTCGYPVDLGCGPVELDLTCVCTDASWMLTGFYDRPELCDCGTLTLPRLCEAYRDRCVWSYADERCEPL